jgi:hypothetical protein
LTASTHVGNSLKREKGLKEEDEAEEKKVTNNKKVKENGYRGRTNQFNKDWWSLEALSHTILQLLELGFKVSFQPVHVINILR